MKILMPAIGSAGDVHPMVGLGVALKRRGHDVVLMTNPHFRPVIEGEGLGFFALGTEQEYAEITGDPDLWHPRRGFETVARRGILPAVRPVCGFIRRHDPSEVVVAAPGLALGARVAQEKWGYALATVHLQPSMLRSAYQAPAYPGLAMPDWLPPWIKRGVFDALDFLALDRVLGPELNRFRAELGLAPARRIFGEWLHSPRRVIGLFPDWFAPPQPDWPAAAEAVGFVAYDRSSSEKNAPPEVEAFLAAGERPVAFTAGTAMRHGREFFAASLATCRRLGRRGLFLTGHAEQLPASLPPFILHAPYVPFSAIFPRAAAVVHHGGIGTTAQALAAGAPQLVVPWTHDQPDNARRVERLGVGTWLSPRRYRSRAAAELRRLLDAPGVRGRCRETAARVDFRSALERAAERIESCASGR